jgi:prepilin-type N-terminal cleavage/methylation domain-containing protein
VSFKISSQQSRLHPRWSPRAFTLVERLVVIAIIGVLVALLLPAIQAAREAARRSQCSNNLKQIGLAVLNYESAVGRLPAGSTTDVANIGGPYYSTWTVDILPYLEQQTLYDLWDSAVDFSHINNRRLRETFLASYLCPSDQDLAELVVPETGPGRDRNVPFAPGSYRAMGGYSLGQDGSHYWDNPEYLGFPTEMPEWRRGALYSVALNPTGGRRLKPVKLKEILDGTSQTLLVGEYHTQTYPSRRTLWAYAYTSYNQSGAFPESRILIPDYERCIAIGGGGVHTCKRAWGSLHAGGLIQFVYCDGSVRSIDQDIDMNIFVKESTIQDEGANLQSAPTPPRGGGR